MRFTAKACPRTLLAVACWAVVLLGCGRSPRECAVTGEVSYQGRPLADGEIIFEDIAGVAPAAFAPIVNGKYQLRTVPGQKKVRITATKETGKVLIDMNGTQCAVRIDVIPPKYNINSTLTYDAQRSTSKVDFALRP